MMLSESFSGCPSESISCQLEPEAVRKVQQRVLAEALPPAENAEPAPERDGPDWGSTLQQLIREELTRMQHYRSLLPRCQPTAGRLLFQLAEENRLQARRLFTDYFLRSGIRYWPQPSIGRSPFRGLDTELRAAFLAEQEGVCLCVAAAEQTADPELQTLCSDLAVQRQNHARRLRNLLEQM